MHKRDIITIITLIVLSGIVLLVVFLLKNDKTEENNISIFTLLSDETTYLSIEKNINKICQYSIHEGSKINFIVKGEIDINQYKNTSFKANKIYEINNMKSYKYYVSGSIFRDGMDVAKTYIRDEFFLLNYDNNNKTFNIEKITEKRFKEASKEKYVFEEISKNDYNEFEYVSLSDKTKALMYFNDYVNKMYSNPEEAYDLLSNETKNNYFNTIDDFKKFIKKYNNISIKEYAIEDDKIGIKDNYGNEYVFEIIYILKYNLTIYKTED